MSAMATPNPSPATSALASHFSAMAPAVAGPAWLTERRDAALASFKQAGLPGRHLETFKYTDLSGLAKLSPQAASSGDIHAEVLKALLLSEHSGAVVVFVNGKFHTPLSKLDRAGTGVSVSNLAQKLSDDPEALEGVFDLSARHKGRHSLHDLNTALASDGVVIEVDRNAVVEQPIHALYINTETAAANNAQLRNIIIAGESSQVTLVEQHIGAPNSSYFSNVVTEVQAGSNADVRHYLIQQDSENGWHSNGFFVNQSRDSRVGSCQFALQGRLLRNDVGVHLQAEGAEIHLDGLYFGNGRQHVDTQTRVDHLKPHGISREFYRGVLDGRSRGVFNGKIVVHPQAQKTDSEQNNRNLLLSKFAEIDTKPELEIYADDVVCAHGVTVGQLDENSLFYLRSRGISMETARSVLTYAFAAETLNAITVASLRQKVRDALLSRLPGGEQVKAFAVADFEDAK